MVLECRDRYHNQSSVSFHHNAAVLSLAFSPDGSLIAAGSQDKKTWVWEVENGSRIGRPIIVHTYMRAPYSLLHSHQPEQEIGLSLALQINPSGSGVPQTQSRERVWEEPSENLSLDTSKSSEQLLYLLMESRSFLARLID